LIESLHSLVEKKEQQFFEQTFNKEELKEYASQAMLLNEGYNS
jgi:hypothetical protein